MFKFLKKEFHDPATGDVWTFAEKASWLVQGVVRNWYFVFFWLFSSIIWWAEPKWFLDDPSYIHWQLWASWLAVAVELIIGIAMIGQTKRDAAILREIKKLDRKSTRLNSSHTDISRMPSSA
mgnify:CR=1 FL=1